MIFNEVYGCYYNAVAEMLRMAIDGKLNEREMYRIAGEYAFEESSLSLVPAIRQQEWQLIDEQYHTPITQKPTMPLTTLEKRWLKTILSDKRMVLFQESTDMLAKALVDVEPLFLPEDVVYFDRYADGDDYEDPCYVQNFHTVMQAIRQRRKVEIHYKNRMNKENHGIYVPIIMEYSDKEDKFRLLSAGKKDTRTMNMGRIITCRLLDDTYEDTVRLPQRATETLVFELTNERKALERAMMKFAHHKKQVERITENTYRVALQYDVEDETDVLIQIMTFGSYVQIVSPKKLKDEMAIRLKKQISLLNW